MLLRTHIKSFNRSVSFDRDVFTPGHYTGSAVVLSPDFSKILLTLHRKLNLWLQLGGHADGETDLFKVALREMEEESGLIPTHYLTWTDPKEEHPALFDTDIHTIPANPKEPEHKHFDHRFVFFADPSSPLKISEESIDLKWFELEEAFASSHDESMRRLIRKIQDIAPQTNLWIQTPYRDQI